MFERYYLAWKFNIQGKSMKPPEPFVWEDRAVNTVRCTDCKEVMSAVTIDLHRC